jgi:SWI/SNF-related matrix-associated actin-dependent regulator of chromatin subfamily A3
MEAIVNIANVRNRIAKAQKASDAIVRVDINLFGPSCNATIVGKMLSDGKIWLQKPDFLSQGVKYENPQFLKIQGFEQQNDVDRQPLEVASSQKHVEKNDERFKAALEDVFNKLTRSDQLQRVEKDRRVKTELLQYGHLYPSLIDATNTP